MTNWSEYQLAVFNWFQTYAETDLDQLRALIVKAVAGSGKTTTIVAAAEYIPPNAPACFLAFNRAIAQELANRLPSHVESRTLNSLGMRAVSQHFRKVNVDSGKLRKIVRELDPITSILDGEEYKPRYFVGDICNLVAKAKAHGFVPNSKLNGEVATPAIWEELADFYGIRAECPDDVLYEAADEVLKRNCELTNIIDFDDQLYFVVAFDIPVAQYQWIIVDEAQDVSHVQREMLKKFLSPSGRFIAVGDDRQAIYGFRGADSSSLDNIVDEFGAEVLPLSITYRCPRLVVERAQQYVPEIQAADNAPEGTVEELKRFEFAGFNDSDLVVCRNTAPLISSAYKMIQNNLPVRVVGRDIGKGLTGLIKKIAGKKFDTMSMGDFEIALNEWVKKQVDTFKRRDQEDRIESVQDKAESIFAIINGADVDTLEELCHAIDDLFRGERGVRFSTVHRAKGLEAERVFIMDSSLMPSRYAKKPWQRKQETNLIYVAVTRSLDTLYYIESKALA